MKTTSINKGFNLNFDTRVTKGEKEVSKQRADVFFRLRQGEFVAFADGKDKKLQFKLQDIQKKKPKPKKTFKSVELRLNMERVHREVKSIFEN